MDGSFGLIARMPALQVDWQTLVAVNLPTLLLVIVAVPLALVGYIVGADVLGRRPSYGSSSTTARIPPSPRRAPPTPSTPMSSMASRSPGSRTLDSTTSP